MCIYTQVAGLTSLSELKMGEGIDFASFLGREPLHVVLHFEDHRRELQLGARGNDHSHWMQLGEEHSVHQVERGFILRLNAWRQVASQSANF